MGPVQKNQASSVISTAFFLSTGRQWSKECSSHEKACSELTQHDLRAW